MLLKSLDPLNVMDYACDRKEYVRVLHFDTERLLRFAIIFPPVRLARVFALAFGKPVCCAI